MEAFLNETEQRSEGDKNHLKEALDKIQSLNEIKDKYEVAIFECFFKKAKYPTRTWRKRVPKTQGCLIR